MKFILQIIYLITIIKFTLQEFIAQSQLEKCYVNGQTEEIDCDKKLIVTMTIENSQETSSEYFKSIIKKSVDKTEENSEKDLILEKSIQIEITKTPVYAIFPLKYKQDFNSNPQEAIQIKSLFGCEDDFYSDDPSCGFARNSSGEKVVDSQGFCCYCDFDDFIGTGESIQRGKVCSPLNVGDNAASAHCLRYDDLWYAAFEIQAYYFYYEIEVLISELNDNDEVTNQRTLNLGSEIKTQKTDDNDVIVKIIGDFTPIQSPANISSKYLMKPSSPLTHPRVLEGTRSWMFIDKDQVTLDGSECNKIGVGYSAFKHESQKCGKQIGSCIKNQLNDFYQKDITKLQNSLQPDYLISSQGDFYSVTLKEDETALMQRIPGTMATMLTIELNADEIQFTQILGAGTIDFAQIQDFEAFSGNGRLVGQITNTGVLSAEFNLEYNCTEYVASIPAEKYFLDAQESRSILTNIQVEYEKTKNNTCELYLKDVIGNQLSNYTIDFQTTEIIHKDNQQNGSEDENKDESIIDDSLKTEITCENACDKFYDVICYFGHGCNGEILKFFSIIILVIAVIALIGWCLKKRKQKENNKKKKTKYIVKEDSIKEKKKISKKSQKSKKDGKKSQDTTCSIDLKQQQIQKQQQYQINSLPFQTQQYNNQTQFQNQNQLPATFIVQENPIDLNQNNIQEQNNIMYVNFNSNDQDIQKILKLPQDISIACNTFIENQTIQQIEFIDEENIQQFLENIYQEKTVQVLYLMKEFFVQKNQERFLTIKPLYQLINTNQ